MKQFALALGAVALLAGCGGDDGATTSPAPQPSSSQVSRLTAVETEFAVKPDKTKVPLGRIVFKGVNEGKVPHILEVEGPGLENETAEIPPGESQTLELTLRTAGSYEIYCPIGDHKKRGMVAKLVVGD